MKGRVIPGAGGKQVSSGKEKREHRGKEFDGTPQVSGWDVEQFGLKNKTRRGAQGQTCMPRTMENANPASDARELRPEVTKLARKSINQLNAGPGSQKGRGHFQRWAGRWGRRSGAGRGRPAGGHLGTQLTADVAPRFQAGRGIPRPCLA